MSIGKRLVESPVEDDVAAALAKKGRVELGIDVAGPLKELDPEKIKEEIKRWAKAVVAYARQISFGGAE